MLYSDEVRQVSGMAGEGTDSPDEASSRRGSAQIGFVKVPNGPKEVPIEEFWDGSDDLRQGFGKLRRSSNRLRRVSDVVGWQGLAEVHTRLGVGAAPTRRSGELRQGSHAVVQRTSTSVGRGIPLPLPNLGWALPGEVRGDAARPTDEEVDGGEKLAPPALISPLLTNNCFWPGPNHNN